MSAINPQIFRAYDIRGRYPEEINPEAAYRIGWAFGKFLKVDQKKSLPLRVALGQDMRGSSPFLAREVARGLTDQGIDVVEIGRVSTPAFYYSVSFRDCLAGAMVTASHMTREYNGLKLALEKAAPVGAESGLYQIQKYAEEEIPKKVPARGSFSSLEGVSHDYVRQDLSYLNLDKLKKFRIAADPANCMGATYLDELFKTISCDPIKMNWELNGNMPVHEANPIKLETLQQIREVIRNEKADIGIATDGDGDRIAFLDELGDPVPSDIIAGLVAVELLKKFPGARIGYDLRCSRSVPEMIRQAGGEPLESRVGHSFIKAMMREKGAIFSGELSGHFYYQENFNYESPVFVVGNILLLMSSLNKRFSEIWRSYKKYFHSGEINFSIPDKEKAMLDLEKRYADGKISKLDGLKVDFEDWWFNVRPSANDPVLRLTMEARTEEQLKEKLDDIKKVIIG